MYNLSICYATVSHEKLKSRLFHIKDNYLLHKIITRKYTFLVIGKQDTYFVRHHHDSKYYYFKADIKGMRDILVDNVYVVVRDQVFQRWFGIHMGTNYAP
jgi:hypothetical protein